MNPVTITPDVQGGTPCFRGTRVPVSTLFVHLAKGYSVAEIARQFPTVSAEQWVEVLDLARREVERQATAELSTAGTA